TATTRAIGPSGLDALPRAQSSLRSVGSGGSRCNVVERKASAGGACVGSCRRVGTGTRGRIGGGVCRRADRVRTPLVLCDYLAVELVQISRLTARSLLFV